MRNFIVAGGSIDKKLLVDQLAKVEASDRYIIACDSGATMLLDCDIVPNYAIGDFDSAKEGTVERLKSLGVETTVLNPVKDDSDAEAAFNLALEKTDGDIYIIGGTGTRLDHVLGNISLLGLGLKRGRKIYLLDSTNRVQMIGPDSTLRISKSNQYGKYISVFPYMGKARVTLEGFKYPLNNYVLEGFSTLTVSNEIKSSEGTIICEEGYLIVLETMDGVN